VKNAFDSGFCTATRCRTFLEPGQGEQFQRPDGTIDRFCRRHAQEEYSTPELQTSAEVRS
jgi:ribosomal protein L24E